MTSQRRATKDDVKAIFCYRGAGFSLDEIADHTGLSRHTVSYQLKKLKYSVEDGDISEVLHSQGLVDNSELIKLESRSSNEISKLAMENMYLQDQLDNYEDPYDGDEPDPPEREEDPPRIVIDAFNVICVNEMHDIDGTPTPGYRFEIRRLKSMMDFLENRGHRVISCMTISSHSFLLHTEEFCDEQDKKILVRMENSGKLLVLDDHDPFYKEALGEHDTLVTNAPLINNTIFPIKAQISSYHWEGPEPTFDNLPEMEDHIESEELDDQLRARGLVLAMLSQEEYIEVPTIHVLLASEILGLKREEQIKWPKGWAAQLKDKLQLSGKTFTPQIKRLMGDEITIKNAKVRRAYHDD